MSPIEHLLRLLDSAAETDADRVWLRGAATLTFSEAARRVDELARRLAAGAVRAGDRVVIVAANHPDVVIAFLGAVRVGAIPAILHDSVRPHGLESVLAQTSPACLVLDAATQSLRSCAPDLAVIMLKDLARRPAGDPQPPNPAAGPKSAASSDPAFLVFTSGTTGHPRGVMVSHANVAFTTRAIQSRLGYRQDDVVGLFVPLSFDYGLYQVFLTLAARASLYVALPGQVPLGLVRTLAAEGVSVLPGVPQLLASAALMLERTGTALPHLRAITNTGERLPDAVAERLSELLPDVQVFSMYGLTECKRVSILLPHEREQRPGSVGRPLDGTHVAILNGAGREVPPGEPGQVVVSGPHVTLGYWDAPAETAERFVELPSGPRTLLTGDNGRIDEDGFLYFEGRIDDQRKRHGFRISLLEIEAVAASAPGVVTAVAVQRPESDELYLFACVHEARVTEAALMSWLRERLEPYKIPDCVHLCAELPTTRHGKVDRPALFQLVRGGR